MDTKAKVTELRRVSDVLEFMKAAVRDCGNRYYQVSDVATDMILLTRDIEEIRGRGDEKFGAKWYFGIRKDGTGFKGTEKAIDEWVDQYARQRMLTAQRLYSIRWENDCFTIILEKTFDNER